MQTALIIGARRTRQGIGEFVTRSLARAGARVVGIVGTSSESVSAARRTLASEPGLGDLAGFTDLSAALSSARPSIVAICSPIERHREQLAAVAAAGCHCLCEKPLWWGEPGEGASGTRGEVTASLVARFAGRGLLLETVTQWPCTLPGFFSLFPEERGKPLRRFTMELGPISRGHGMVLDAAPHAISMIQALAGPGRVDSPSATVLDDSLERLDLRFGYLPGGSAGVPGDAKAAEAGVAPVGPSAPATPAALPPRVEVELRLRACPAPPRPAAYSINGRRVRREIVLPQYSFEFVTEEDGNAARRLPLRDPLEALVEGFLDRVARGAPTDTAAIVAAMENLERLVEAARDAETRPAGH